MKLTVYKADGSPVDLLDTQDPVLFDTVIDALAAISPVIVHQARPAQVITAGSHYVRRIGCILAPLVTASSRDTDLGMLQFLQNRVDELQQYRSYIPFDPSI